MSRNFKDFEPQLREMFVKCADYYLLQLGYLPDEVNQKLTILDAVRMEFKPVYVWNCPLCRFRTESIHPLQLIQRAIEHYLRCEIKRKRRV